MAMLTGIWRVADGFLTCIWRGTQTSLDANWAHTKCCLQELKMQYRPDAEKIKRWREERLWSQEHLADLAGVGLRTVQRIENGESASRDSVAALAAAFNVDAAALTVNTEAEAAVEGEKKARKALAGLRLGFFINLACWVFGMILFAAISWSDGNSTFEMLAPAIWWTVGIAGFGLTVVIVELATHFKRAANT